MTHLEIDMSENDQSQIDMVADSVGSDTCQYLWVVFTYFSSFTGYEDDIIEVISYLHV